MTINGAYQAGAGVSSKLTQVVFEKIAYIKNGVIIKVIYTNNYAIPKKDITAAKWVLELAKGAGTDDYDSIQFDFMLSTGDIVQSNVKPAGSISIIASLNNT